MLESSSLCLYSSNLGTFWLKIEQFWPLTFAYFDRLCKLEKRGDEITKNSSLKLLCQSQPNFAEMNQVHFSQVWLRLAQQFQRRRFFFNFIPPFSNLHNRSK
jgi:hypothetical protein